MSDQRTLTVGLLGCGVVGSGVIRLLRDHAEEIAGRVGAQVRVGPVVVRDLSKPRDIQVELTDDPAAVVGAAGVDIVVEVMGGIDPARELLSAALSSGQAAVTANKELLATHGAELIALSVAKAVRLEYEAAVAGAIPIIKPLRESLAGDRVRKVIGILNGTTNYILTRMTEEGAELAPVLADAQALGYAEADPTADVGGFDAAAKCAILASLAFDADVRLGDVYTEGIMDVTAIDIANANRMGYVIKLLGIAEEHDLPDGGRSIGVRVHPAWIPKAHPLASIREAFNAIFVEADAAGELMFYGRGAGSLPTASAVVGDVVTAARAMLAGERLPSMAVVDKPIQSPQDAIVEYYLLLNVADEPGVLAGVAKTFGDHHVSIKNVWQEGEGDLAQLLLITHAAREGNVADCIAALADLSSVNSIASTMRVEDRRPV